MKQNHQISVSWFFLFLLTSILAVSPLAEGRWLTPAEADISIDSENIRVQIDATGKTLFDTTVRMKILNEKGRDRFGTMKFTYSPKNEIFKIIKAETHNGTEVLKVNSKDIIDTAVEATENGFDEQRQVLIPFQEVQVGSVLVYEFKSNFFRPNIENHHSNRYFFGRDLQNHLDLVIESVRPLHFHINDPTGSLEKVDKTEKNTFRYHITLKKPIFQQVANEIRSIIPDELLTWIAFSTAGSYEELFVKLASRYNQMLEAPLPGIFQEILEKAKKEKSGTAQINLVLSLLSEKIRYMGDWRAVDGGFVPRPFTTIAATRFGDCKDMSLLTTKILRELGYQSANVVFVARGGTPANLTKVAHSSFNHAIVTVQSDNKTLWLDPTNFQSFAQGVPEDIGGRESVVITGPQIAIRKIEFNPPEDNTDYGVYHMKFLSEQRRIDQIDRKYNGFSAFQMTGNELRYSREQIQEDIISSFVNETDVISSKFEKLELKDRIVKPISMKFTIDRHYRPAPTTVGPGFIIYPSSIAIDFNRIDVANRVSHLYLGMPFYGESVSSIENFQIKGNRIDNCDIKSPWFDHVNRVDPKSKPVQIVASLRVKKYWISPEEMKTPEFKKLQDQIRKCSNDRYLIYSVPRKIKN